MNIEQTLPLKIELRHIPLLVSSHNPASNLSKNLPACGTLLWIICLHKYWWFVCIESEYIPIRTHIVVRQKLFQYESEYQYSTLANYSPGFRYHLWLWQTNIIIKSFLLNVCLLTDLRSTFLAIFPNATISSSSLPVAANRALPL